MIITHHYTLLSAFGVLFTIANAMENRHRYGKGQESQNSHFGSQDMPPYPHQVAYEVVNPYLPSNEAGLDERMNQYDDHFSYDPGMDYGFHHLQIASRDPNLHQIQNNQAFTSYGVNQEIPYTLPTFQWDSNVQIHQHALPQYASTSTPISATNTQDPHSSQDHTQQSTGSEELEGLSDLDIDILNRSDRLNRYTWQFGLFKDQIIHIYAIIAPLWEINGEPLKRNTLMLRLKRLDELLENDPSLVQDILAGRHDQIKEVVVITRPARIVDRSKEKKPDKVMTIQELLTWLQTPSGAHVENGRLPSWYNPEWDLRSGQRREISKALEKAWNKGDTTTRRWMVLASEEDPTILKSCLPDLLSKDPIRVHRAASILKSKKDIATSRNIMIAKQRRSALKAKRDRSTQAGSSASD